MKTVRGFKDLNVWQKAYDLCLQIYKTTKNFPKDEQYGLSSQLRRAAVSVPANVAEGSSRRHTQDYLRFVNIAFSSTTEVETYILLAKDLRYVSSAAAESLLDRLAEVQKMLRGLTTALESKDNPSFSPNH